MLEPDLVIKLSADQCSLRAYLKKGSRIKSRLEQVRAVHFIRKEAAYYFPVEELSDFLKSLRNSKYRFAIESQAGKVLRFSAELRNSILLGKSGQSFSGQDFQAALLCPFVVANRDGNFSLKAWTSEQLRQCMPAAYSFSEKKKLAASFSLEALQKLLFQAALNGLRIWCSAEVEQHLALLRESYERSFASELSEFNDEWLGIFSPPACWICDVSGQGGVLLEVELCKSLFEELSRDQKKDLAVLTEIGIRDRVFLRVRDSRMLALLGQIESLLKERGLHSHRSLNFAALLKQLIQREELRRRRVYYQELQDTALGLQNCELEPRLFAHQRVAVSWLLETRRGILGDDMGLGKTLSTLAAFDELKARGEIELLLVICPNSLTLNWLRESKQWLPGRRALAFPSGKKDRLEILQDLKANKNLPDILIVNYEASRLEYVQPELLQLAAQRKTLLCLDESQRVKNSQSKTFLALEPIALKCDRRLLLTGTPTPKDITDIWSQMKLLDGGERFGDNYFSWLSSVAELGNKWSEWAVNRFIPERVEETIARVHEVLLRRKKESVLDLPEKLFSVRDLEMKGDQLKRYNEIRKELLLRVRSISGKEFQRSIESILEEYLRAVQIASNPRLIDPSWKGDPVKFSELDEIVEELVAEAEQKLVLWTNFKHNVTELTERYAKHGTAGFSGDVSVSERAASIERFQKPDSDLRILVAIPAAGGVGITLTAARTAVYLDKTWNAEHWLQSVDRIHRIGQTGTVNIVSLHASPVDVLISRSLASKQRAQDALMSESTILDQSYPSQAELIEVLSAD